MPDPPGHVLDRPGRETGEPGQHPDLAYRDPAEFITDLRLVQDELAQAGAAGQAYGELQNTG